MNRNDRIQIEYKLTFASPFHFGAGMSAGLVDRTVIRDDSGYLYVPASTFKGVLRQHCEQLCRFYFPDQQAAITSPHDAYAALADFSGTLTPITRIFGSHIYPGKLRFYNAEQKEQERLSYESSDRGNDKQWRGNYKGIQTSISTQVRIDRLTRTAVNEALYTSEFGIRDLVFDGSINGWLECTPVEELAVTGHDEMTYTGTPTYSLLLLLAVELCTQEQRQFWLEHLNALTKYPLAQRGK